MLECKQENVNGRRTDGRTTDGRRADDEHRRAVSDHNRSL